MYSSNKNNKKDLEINLTKEVKDIKEINWRGQINQTINLCGLKEFILLKWPYYKKQPRDLKQSLLQYSWDLSQN